MYRILLADDEPYIVDDLEEYLSGLGQYELEIFKAYSGDEVISFLGKVRVDILISDIRMPNINGMEILEYIRKKWLQCKVIFLTGHTDFHYIHSALANNVSGYILKTEGKNEIRKAINKAMEEIEKELHDEHLISLAEAQIKKAIPILQQEFITDLLQKNKSALDQLSEKVKDLDIQLKTDRDVLLLVGKVDHCAEMTVQPAKVENLYKIQTVTCRYISQYCTVFPVIYEKSLLLWFIQPSSIADSWEKLVEFIKKILESVQTSCKKLLNIKVSFSLSSEPVPWDKLADRFEILHFLLERDAGYINEALLLDSSLSAKELEFILGSTSERLKANYYRKTFRLLSAYLENAQSKEFMEHFDTITRYMMEQPQNCNFNLEIYHSITLLFITYMNKWGLPSSISGKMPWESPSFSFSAEVTSDMLACYRRLAEAIFESKDKERKDRSDNAIKFLQKYVNEHLNEDLSLMKLADLVYLHPNYLSRLYKQETGSTISEYISEVRLNLAEKLLKNTEMKVIEISTATGYESAPYFIRFFKKKTGMTPQEYRVLSR